MDKYVDECILASLRGDIDKLTEIARTRNLGDYQISVWGDDLLKF